MEKRVKIISTIGPGSNKPEILERLKDRGVDFFRINLSHTEEENIELRIRELLGYGVPIILDTEGSQVRSGNTEEIDCFEGENIRIYNQKISCSKEKIFLKPLGIVNNLREGDLISIDFNSALFKVFDIGKIQEGYIDCKVLIGGKVGGKKAVHIDSPTFLLPPFSKKDHMAFVLGQKYGIKHFTLSFMESKTQVEKFKAAYPDAIAFSKIESRKGLDNFLDIAKVSDGILIDRGDLSTQVPLEKIPLIQKYIISKCKDLGKEIIVATNTLEQMSFSLKPNKAEINDIINTILDGATAIALTKETAVGKYPVETVNMLQTLIDQIEFVKGMEGNLIANIEKTNYLNEESPELLVKPHGGKLINRFPANYQGKIPEKKIEINEESLMDAEQIAIGAFSPIEGFMGSKDFNSVVENMRLSNGTIWTLPILLDVDEDAKNHIFEGEDIALTHKGEVYAILHLNEIYRINKEEVAKKIYGTNDLTHPGVKNFLNLQDYFLGGKITLLRRKPSKNKIFELTPKQSRRIFSERGWSKVVGFHTRNVIHKSHEFIQLSAFEKGRCDGLFVHPIIGKKKSGDFESDIIIQTYEKMIDEFYPKYKVVMGTFATYSRYCGPREAIFTALTRKNFGCSHFIVGRDHTGVGDFYDPKASHEIFDKFSKEELGIIPIKFDKVFYSEIENKYIHESEFIDHSETNKLHISGTQAREILKNGQQPPTWFMRPEISQIIMDRVKNNLPVFIS